MCSDVTARTVGPTIRPVRRSFSEGGDQTQGSWCRRCALARVEEIAEMKKSLYASINKLPSPCLHFSRRSARGFLAPLQAQLPASEPAAPSPGVKNPAIGCAPKVGLCADIPSFQSQDRGSRHREGADGGSRITHERVASITMRRLWCTAGRIRVDRVGISRRVSSSIFRSVAMLRGWASRRASTIWLEIGIFGTDLDPV